jgi:hypothetical protein
VTVSPREWVKSSETRLLIASIVVLLPISLYASQIVRAYANSQSAVRIITLSEGLARFSYVSNWLVWVISFAAILVTSRLGKSEVLKFAVVSAAAIGIVTSVAWTGGRSIIVLMVFPLVAVVSPYLRGTRRFAIPLWSFAAIVYIRDLTVARSVGYATDTFSVTSWLDWQWGRFSMLGFAHQYVATNGFLYGETLLAGVLQPVFGLFRLIGLGVSMPSLRAGSEVATQSLLNTTSPSYIVPGITAELYLNGGYLLLIFGCYAIGRAVAWIDGRFMKVDGAVPRLAWAYVGSLAIFRTVNSDSGAFWSYLVFSGLPLLVIAWISGRLRARAVAGHGLTALPDRTSAGVPGNSQG